MPNSFNLAPGIADRFQVIADRLQQSTRDLEGRLGHLEISIKESNDGLANLSVLQTRFDALERSTYELQTELPNSKQSLLESRLEALEERTNELQAEMSTPKESSLESRLEALEERTNKLLAESIAPSHNSVPATNGDRPYNPLDEQTMEILRKGNNDLQTHLQIAEQKFSVFESRLESIEKSNESALLKVSQFSLTDHARLVNSVQVRERLEQCERKLESSAAMNDLKDMGSRLGSRLAIAESRLDKMMPMESQMQVQADKIDEFRKDMVEKMMESEEHFSVACDQATKSAEAAVRLGTAGNARLKDIESKLETLQKLLQMDNVTSKVPTPPSSQGPLHSDTSAEKMPFASSMPSPYQGVMRRDTSVETIPRVSGFSRQSSPFQSVSIQPSNVVPPKVVRSSSIPTTNGVGRSTSIPTTNGGRSTSSPTTYGAPQTYKQSRESSPGVGPWSYKQMTDAPAVHGTPSRTGYQTPGVAMPQSFPDQSAVLSGSMFSPARMMSPRTSSIVEVATPRVRADVQIMRV